jgi:hypothetical protein
MTYDSWKTTEPDRDPLPHAFSPDCGCGWCIAEAMEADIGTEPCSNCGGTGYSHHNCGEDCCSCAEPEDNVPCDWCSP